MNPLILSKPSSTRDPTKLNVGFQAEVESKNLLLNPIRGGVSTNVQVANQAKWSQGALLNESEVSKEFSSEEEWVKNSTRSSKNTTTEENRNATFYQYIPDIKDILKDKFAKASMLGLDVGVTSKKDENVNKINVLVIDNHLRERKNYIQLCKRLTDRSTSLMQKLRGKDCVKLPSNEFYLDSTRNSRKDDTFRFVGLKIATKTDSRKDYRDSASNKNKQRSEVTNVEAAISDVSANNDESSMKVSDKFGTGLIKMIDDRIANLLRDGKFSLSASTALKV